MLAKNVEPCSRFIRTLFEIYSLFNRPRFRLCYCLLHDLSSIDNCLLYFVAIGDKLASECAVHVPSARTIQLKLSTELQGVEEAHKEPIAATTFDELKTLDALSAQEAKRLLPTEQHPQYNMQPVAIEPNSVDDSDVITGASTYPALVLLLSV